MSIEKYFKNEYPIFVRGTCVEEAIWLLGFNRDKFKSRITKIYAFPLQEGFAKANIKPIKPIPINYTLEKIRDEVISPASHPTYGPSMFKYGDDFHNEEFLSDKNRWGVVIYFSPRIIKNLTYEQDDDVSDRLDELCAVRINIPEDFDPNNICLVEPLGFTDFQMLLDSKIPKDKYIPFARFGNEKNLSKYINRNHRTINFASKGFNFPF